MSRIGKKKLEVPSGVTIDVKPGNVVVKGPKGELTQSYLPAIEFQLEDGGKSLFLKEKEGVAKSSAFQGLYRALVKNMIEGVSKGFVKQLDITGVGYKVASVSGAKIVLNIGFSKPVEFVAPKGIKIESPTPLEIIISGIDKQLVGQVASEIRAIRKPEPYKAKGIRYRNEVIRRKAGKAVGGK